MDNEWDELDVAAKANLGEEGFVRFQRYKNKLQSEGHKWHYDAEDILRGYIWDEIEDLDPDA
ncbi:MAG: hypothetical protein JRC60_05695 [Deltaproteobacteria bacterium]|nr:hypothetical protein [Deltaproteobacteria bacterium]